MVKFHSIEIRTNAEGHFVKLLNFVEDDRSSPFFGTHSVIASYRLTEPDKRIDNHPKWDIYGQILAQR